jgi:hypothetical protein
MAKLTRLPLLEVKNEIFRELLTYKLLTCRDRILKSACSGDQPYSTILRFCYNFRWACLEKVDTNSGGFDVV